MRWFLRSENVLRSIACAVLLLHVAAASAAQQSSRELAEIVRFNAPEARQGVAVDGQHLYAITDRAIGKYDKQTGALITKWEGARDGPIIHLDGGVVIDGKLYAAHSNYPNEPMTSSVEIYDAATLKPIGSHSFGIMWGSLTWLDRHDGAWWAVFANYSRVFGQSQRPYGNSYWTTLVKFDDKGQWQQGWIFPSNIIKRSEPMSISGGSWGPDGLLYVTGHDHAEVYVIRLPRQGSILEHVETIPFAVEGQGIAWDRSQPGVLYGISRANSQLVGARLRKKETPQK
jgi:hypothetical protein